MLAGLFARILRDKLVHNIFLLRNRTYFIIIYEMRAAKLSPKYIQRLLCGNGRMVTAILELVYLHMNRRLP